MGPADANYPNKSNGFKRTGGAMEDNFVPSSTMYARVLRTPYLVAPLKRYHESAA